MTITTTPLDGINVRVDTNGTDYAYLICTQKKTVETRDRNTLGKQVGKRVRIIRTGYGKQRGHAIGEATITKCFEYTDVKAFKEDMDRHCVREDSDYWYKTKKYGYVIEDAVLYPQAYPIENHGIVVRTNTPYIYAHIDN